MFFLLNSIAILLCSLCQGAALKIYNVFFFFASFLFCVYVLLLLLLLLLLLMLTVCTQLTDICVINSAFCALLKKKKVQRCVFVVLILICAGLLCTSSKYSGWVGALSWAAGVWRSGGGWCRVAGGTLGGDNHRVLSRAIQGYAGLNGVWQSWKSCHGVPAWYIMLERRARPAYKHFMSQ